MTYNKLKNTQNRFGIIDALRGLALINMLAFHLFYDLFMIYGLDKSWYFQTPTVIWERVICVSFVVISGISFNFSKHSYRHGLILNVFGFAITAVTFYVIPNEVVWFGILNFLGCAMLLLEPFRKYLEKTTPVFGMTVSMLMFAFLYEVPSGFVGFFTIDLINLPADMYTSKWLAFLGFAPQNFISSDFFPVIPWIFLFVFGYFLWRFVKLHNAEKHFRRNVPVLCFAGRHSLIIYLVHQPLFMAVLYCIFGR